MKITLTRPLVFFDLETTGLNLTEDRIIEISMVKMFPDEHTETKTLRINPGRHIPEDSSAIHGIYDKDVMDCPLFEQVAAEIVDNFRGCDIAGYNSDHFDIPMLQEAILRAGVGFNLMSLNRIDVQTIFHKREPRNLQAAYRLYVDPAGFDGAHGAEADTMATYKVFLGELERYDDLGNSVEEIARYTQREEALDCGNRIVKNGAGQAVFNFGKYKGQLVEDVFRREPSYYNWMLQGDFPLHTKYVIGEIKRKMK